MCTSTSLNHIQHSTLVYELLIILYLQLHYQRSMSRSMDLHNHYLNSRFPDEIPENLIEFFRDDDGLSYEEALLQQESMYQSFQERDKNKKVAAIDDDIIYLCHLLQEEEEDEEEEEKEGECSRHEGVMTQEAIDEALARSLQELGEGFDDIIISEHSRTASGSTQSPIATPSRAHSERLNSMQDSIDPDSMQYEELLHLAEAIGVENRGISATRISQLPTSKYGYKLFSKNKKKEENCVICQSEFNFGERLITLPCLHQYHIKCISEWLKMKKNCPICQKEVV
ncbi:unnamed protein product [Lactuca saligna]|uniref:RING-type domain-containing protein n=1 Tax=Lactuca saligna TaxID=75948 RepID=A0AA36A2Q5_LACSI|nr:unnamed protein product [Lactuca saligna]